MKGKRVWRMLSGLCTLCDLESFIIWMTAWSAQSETARKETTEALEGAGPLGVMEITWAFFVG